MSRVALFMTMILPVSLFAQSNVYNGFPSLVWPKLYSTTFVKVSDEHGEYDKPVFNSQVKSLEGRTITLPGYMVPFENGTTSSVFMLSSLPLNACFFCGVGGPETVVEIHLKAPADFSEKPIEVRGILQLNSSDPDAMIYVLEQAEITGAPGF